MPHFKQTILRGVLIPPPPSHPPTICSSNNGNQFESSEKVVCGNKELSATCPVGYQL